MAGRPVDRVVTEVQVRFRDRVDAGRRLAARLDHLRHEQAIVCGLPRGGVPVAFEVAKALGLPLEIIVVRKLGVPHQPELAMGAVGEGGARFVNQAVVTRAGVSAEEFDRVERREAAEAVSRSQRWRRGRAPADLADRTVVIVDDGLATGSSAVTACRVARYHGAARVVLAVPVAPIGWSTRLSDAADEYVCLETPQHMVAVGSSYLDFSPTRDADVVDCLAQAAARPDP